MCMASHSVRTSKRPYALKVVSNNDNIDKGELAQIVIQVVDEDGVQVMLSDDEITCNIIGEGVLMGLEASNNRDMSDYTDNSQRVFHGQILAYIKSKGTGNEEIKVRFSSPWLKSAETTIKVN